ncbi:putative Ribosomal protein L34e [Trypanosoma vivax]|uniref:Putative 60S ribosomal protein L34 n=1 Tax=Trypanosoma vivax (strain Y486) TaxID=1055687 RepID=G0U428_TRYVY|nr:putative Ribosomal protein L34e [Trypanosoma vivax]CCC52190.1 putative 60S ribosomal protein L34 [Trypanosoma vivax Y486]
MSCPRVSYRRRMHYATRGNRMRLVRTPGNRLVMQKRGKRSQGPHTPWVLGHKRLAGTKALRHTDARHAPRHEKTTSRPYGGVLSHDQVRDRIVRAFLIEEQRIVKRALKAHAKAKKERKRSAAKRKRKEETKATAAKKVAAKVAVKSVVTKKTVPKKATGKAPVGANLKGK